MSSSSIRILAVVVLAFCIIPVLSVVLSVAGSIVGGIFSVFSSVFGALIGVFVGIFGAVGGVFAGIFGSKFFLFILLLVGLVYLLRKA